MIVSIETGLPYTDIQQ